MEKIQIIKEISQRVSEIDDPILEIPTKKYLFWINPISNALESKGYQLQIISRSSEVYHLKCQKK